jgi:hypothetical protein
MVGGSTASSVHGLVRMTRDIDIVINLLPDAIEPLVSELKAEYYVDGEQIRSALEQHRSFNLIHYRSSYKFDIFPLTGDRFQQKQFERRRYEKSTMFTVEPLEFSVASPEDVILSKLRWFRNGGEVSTQQWNDVIGVIAVQREKLDAKYLGEWALYLGVEDLLAKALGEEA